MGTGEDRIAVRQGGNAEEADESYGDYLRSALLTHPVVLHTMIPHPMPHDTMILKLRLKMSLQKLYKLAEEQCDPLQLRPISRIFPQTLQHHGVEDRHDKGVAISQGLLGSLEPVLLVCALGVDAMAEGFVVEKEGVLAEEELVHDDPQREDVVLVVVVRLRTVILRGGVGHREAGVVH
jgi:hypothetical protein